MGTFLVSTINPNPRVEALIASEFADAFYKFSDRVYFVTGTGTAQEIARRLGVGPRIEGQEYTGVSDIVVTKLEPNYWGFHTNDLWNWLSSSFQKAG